MDKKFLAGMVSCFCVASSVHADYQYEIRIGQTNTDQQTRVTNELTVIPGAPPVFIGPGQAVTNASSRSLNQRDTKNSNISGSYYFDSVPTLAIPNQEAGFLARQSQLYFGLSQIDTDTVVQFTSFTNMPIRSTSDAESDEYRFGGEYAFPENPWVLGLEYLTGDSKFSAGTFSAPGVNEDITQWRYSVGFYPTERSRLRLSLSDSKRETNAQVRGFVSPTPGPIGFLPPQRTTINSEQISADYRHLFDLFTAQFLAINLDYSQLSSDLSSDASAYSAGLDYYPIANLSLGVAYTESKPDFGSDQVSHVYRVKYFVNESVAVSLVAQTSDDRETSVNNDPFIATRSSIRFERDSLSLGLDMRF